MGTMSDQHLGFNQLVGSMRLDHTGDENRKSALADAELDLSDFEEPAHGLSALSQGAPSAPLLGRLPLARVVPQDVHSLMDYVDGATVAAGAFLTTCPKATAASLLLGTSAVAVSALTDYRLSVAKVIPIETHEVVDYGFGAAAITAPFLFGYYKTAPIVAAMHVATGVGTILASLFTDYRAYRGIGRR